LKQLYEIIQFNREFVQNKGYEPFQTTKFPNKRMVILTCMDTRLVELLPHAMNIRNGDVKIVKNAGAMISHPFGSIMRSLVVAVYALQAEEIYVIAHHDCGMSQVDSGEMLSKMKERGIPDNVFDTLQNAGIDLNRFLSGFKSTRENVENSVRVIRNHPLIPKSVPVHGLIIHPDTGELELVIDGYESQA
jgi:carbonic anhydrase